MTTSQTGRKFDYKPLVRVPYKDGLDGVVLLTPDHLLLFFTMPVKGRREIIGLQIVPKPPNLKPTRNVASLSHGWVAPRLEAFHSSLPAKVTPVSAALLRGIPLGTVMAFREQDARDRAHMAEVMKTQGHQVRLGNDSDFSAKDQRLLPYLDDALMYVQAIAEGAKPALVIAEARGVSKRTAEGRVAKARELGLLTPATGRHASGSLTAVAKRLQATQERLTQLEEGRSNG